MRLATIRAPLGTRAVLVDGEVARELDAPDVGALLAASEGAATLPLTGAEHAARRTRLRAPCPRAAKIFCLGLNYRAHILEMGHEFPDHPTVFAKFPISLVGARDDVWLPRGIGRGRLGGRARRGDRPHRAPRVGRRSARRDRGLHRRERRLDARLAVPDAAVAAGQDVGTLDAGRPVPRDARRDRPCRRPPRHVCRRRRGDAGRPYVGSPLRPRRDHPVPLDDLHAGARATSSPPGPPPGSATAGSRPSTSDPAR